MYYQRKAVYKMKIKHLVPVMPVRNGKVNGQDGVKLAGFYSDNGADAILVFDLSDSDEEHEKNYSAAQGDGTPGGNPYLCRWSYSSCGGCKKDSVCRLPEGGAQLWEDPVMWR